MPNGSPENESLAACDAPHAEISASFPCGHSRSPRPHWRKLRRFHRTQDCKEHRRECGQAFVQRWRSGAFNLVHLVIAATDDATGRMMPDIVTRVARCVLNR